MACAEFGGEVVAFGEGELDAGGGEFSAADDGAHVVEHGAGPEDGVEEFGGEVGVEDGAVLDETAEADFAFDGDEGADGAFGAIGARARQMASMLERRGLPAERNRRASPRRVRARRSSG